ncbi:MAG TPA: flavin reductase family protein [Syntrophorhabdaceae bacterium]|nr:flavin reductase family protein [Syntrophorhabdaceae bacterium]
MAKIEIDSDRVLYPMPCSLVGANVGGKPNYLTVAWFTMVNPEPAYLAAAMNKVHYTNSGIKENGTFSINIPSSAMAEVTDYCGLVSGRKFDKAARFNTFYGKLKTAPMISECPLNVELKLIKTVELPAEELFIGEIETVYCDERYVEDGVPQLKKIMPFVLIMSEKKYVGLGDEIGPAWGLGKKLMK